VTRPDAAVDAAGWRVVGGLFCVLAMSSGLGFYNQSVYLEALSGAAPGTRAGVDLPLAAVSAAVSVFFVASALTGLVVARALQHVDVRAVMVAGALVAGAALASFGGIDDTFRLYLTYALFGTGYACISLIPATTLVTAWFVERRGLALSVASTGLSLGGVVLTPLTAWLLAVLPFADAMRWLGCGLVVVVVPAALWLVRAPPAVPRSAAGGRGAAYATVVRGRHFQLLTLAFVVVMCAQVGGIAHQFTLVVARADAVVAAACVSSVAAGSVAGRLAGGWCVDRVGATPLAFVNMVGQAAGLGLLSVAASPALLLAGSLLFGLTVGNLLVLQPLLLAARYAGADYGRIYALSQSASSLGVAAGPFTVGALQPLLGYGGAYATLAVASLLSLVPLAAALAVGSSMDDGAVPGGGQAGDGGEARAG
jgi:MFS family permease